MPLSKRRSKPVLLFFIDITRLHPYASFLMTAGGAITSYCLYGYLQESIFSSPNFYFPWCVSLLQFSVFFALSYVETLIHKPLNSTRPLVDDADASSSATAASASGARVPMRTYLSMSVLLVLSFGLSNQSLIYLTYPIKVIIKSCKLLPVMVLGLAVQQKRYHCVEYVCALLLVLGLILFTMGDRADELLGADDGADDGGGNGGGGGGGGKPSSVSFFGLFLSLSSLFADSLLNNLQELSMATYHCSPHDLVFYNSGIALLLVSGYTLLSGELVAFAAYLAAAPWLLWRILVLVFTGYLGVVCYLALIHTRGVLIAVIVATLRKFITLALSFALFPKPFATAHAIGMFLIFASLGARSYWKLQKTPHLEDVEVFDDDFGAESGPPVVDLLETEAAAADAAARYKRPVVVV